MKIQEAGRERRLNSDEADAWEAQRKANIARLNETLQRFKVNGVIFSANGQEQKRQDLALERKRWQSGILVNPNNTEEVFRVSKIPYGGYKVRALGKSERARFDHIIK